MKIFVILRLMTTNYLMKMEIIREKISTNENRSLISF